MMYLVARVGRRLHRSIDAAFLTLIEKWANENGWEIVKCQRRSFGSPWMFSTSGAQGIYHVTVCYHEGQPRIRKAWLRCGGWFLGAKTEKVEMRWDGASQPLPEPVPEPLPPAPQDDPLWDRSLDG
jgi:hypothetical protein